MEIAVWKNNEVSESHFVVNRRTWKSVMKSAS